LYSPVIKGEGYTVKKREELIKEVNGNCLRKTGLLTAGAAKPALVRKKPARIYSICKKTVETGVNLVRKLRGKTGRFDFAPARERRIPSLSRWKRQEREKKLATEVAPSKRLNTGDGPR